MKKATWKTYAFWILLSEIVGALSALLTREGTNIYTETVTQPPLSPPPIVFPIVWGILFALMGIGMARVYAAPASGARSLGLRLFFLQLVFNFFWSILFFNYQNFGFALIWLVALWLLIFGMTVAFFKADKPAAWLQVPYLVWVAFAAYLNFGVWILNG